MANRVVIARLMEALVFKEQVQIRHSRVRQSRIRQLRPHSGLIARLIQALEHISEEQVSGDAFQDKLSIFFHYLCILHREMNFDCQPRPSHTLISASDVGWDLQF